MKTNAFIILSGHAGALLLCTLLFNSCQKAPTTLSIGSGSGAPGSENRTVEIILDNPINKVKGIQADICDEGNYLVGVACEPKGSASPLSCTCNELSSGCLRVLLFSTNGNAIEEGTGAVISLRYTVSDDAPAGQCIELIPQKVLVSDEDNNPLTSLKSGGTFCFSS